MYVVLIILLPLATAFFLIDVIAAILLLVGM